MLLLAALTSARFLRDRHGGGPGPGDWPLGPYHWPAQYSEFIPANVADVCGGYVGHTKWGDVNPACADYSVRTSICVQSCLGSNSLGGFAGCLKKCGSSGPDFAFCEGAADPHYTTYCHEFTNRTKVCKCFDETAIQTGQQYHDCMDQCVFTCSTAFETELLLGIKLPWRSSKCGAGVFFSCGGSDGLQCRPTPAYECEGPVGIGVKECFADDPWCSDPQYVCAIPTNETIPLPAEVVREAPENGWAGLFYPTPPPPPPNDTNASNASIVHFLGGNFDSTKQWDVRNMTNVGLMNTTWGSNATEFALFNSSGRNRSTMEVGFSNTTGSNGSTMEVGFSNTTGGNRSTMEVGLLNSTERNVTFVQRMGALISGPRKARRSLRH